MGCKIKTADFSTLSLTVLSNGSTELKLEVIGRDPVTIKLLPEELGILLTSFGNSIVKGRENKRERLKEFLLKVEKNRSNVYEYQIR